MTTVGYQRRLGFSLRDRLLALNLGTVLILVLSSLLLVDVFASRQIRQLVAEELILTGSIFSRLVQERAHSLGTQSLVIAEDPRFSATLDVPTPDLEAHARTVGSEAKHFQGILGSDLFVVTNRTGTVLSRLELRRPATIDARSSGEDYENWQVGGSAMRVVDVSVAVPDGRTAQLAIGFATPFDPQPARALLREMAADSVLGDHLAAGRTDAVLRDLQVAFVPGIAAVLEADGTVLDMLLCHASHGQNLANEPAIAAALHGDRYTGLRAEGGQLYQIVSVPVWSPDGLLGALLTGYQIDDELAADLRSMTHSHVSFFTDSGRLVASTWSGVQRQSLRRPDKLNRPFESDVGTETFLTLAGNFGTDDGASGTFVIQQSLDEAYSFLQTLEELLLLVAFVVVILAGVASFVGARRLTRPVKELVNGTRALGAGDLDHRIRVSSRSELGELAAAFNEMAADLQQSRQTLVESEKLRALGEMAAGVAHNFNNLLTVVVGNAELINLHKSLPAEIQQETRGILDSARRCSAIVRRIQTFGRPIDLSVREWVDLSELSREVIELTRPKWKTESERNGRRIRIDAHLAALPSIQTQGSAWEEILSNLIFNAVDAMPEGGLITVTTTVEEDSILLSVHDTGTGMDEETQQRIFEPFYTTKGRDAGTGLGLSTVWSLVRQLGGRVDVESRLGEGTIFRLRAPLNEESPRHIPSPVATDAATSTPLDILVVDDEPQVLELIPPLLTGHRVATARGGSRGLDLAGQQDFDVVLSDWVMDEASGLEVAAAARQRNDDAVIILMTGWEFDAESVQGGGLVDLVLSKPFQRDTVRERVQTAQQILHARRVSSS